MVRHFLKHIFLVNTAVDIVRFSPITLATIVVSGILKKKFLLLKIVKTIKQEVQIALSKVYLMAIFQKAGICKAINTQTYQIHIQSGYL